MTDLLTAVSSCLGILGELPITERARAMTALRTVLDLAEVQPILYEPPKDDGGGYSSRIERWVKSANEQKEKPARLAPKASDRRRAPDKRALCLEMASRPEGVTPKELKATGKITIQNAHYHLNRLNDEALLYRKNGRYHTTDASQSQASNTTRGAAYLPETD